ncbi:YhcH/YjgK/YiaL family protein [Marinilabilia salmonicolor]|jgi:YhcH/YjgK/YiaL family protein|uniref:YhcH/YjgK/YiaL family protein n=1 Tax=Marinilabilia salmonicolor TaxID=989 RepID=A0A368V003_9BACT|nr:YhcH/YjgK/YiaL family protein [Marinilabilia salmonicolor]RCW34527.1 YhcH/YjgK/YiaL family protein [Marinilabilia salmonicolor]
MVIDTFENAARYYMLHPAMEIVLDYLENLDSSEFEAGRVELSGSDVFVNAMEQTTVSEDEAVWESHEKHIDIHYLMEGHEMIKYAEEYKMEVEVPYDEEKDCTLFTGDSGMKVNHPKGAFVIFFPEEIHKAMVTDGIPSKVKKLVGKIKVD